MKDMFDTKSRIIGISGRSATEPEVWSPIVIPKREIDLEIGRLSSVARPADGRRAAAIVHPRAQAPGLGLAPGIGVTLGVLNPGEATVPLRSNANLVEICIGGRGVVSVEGRAEFEVTSRDAWNVPSMKIQSYRATGDAPFIRLSYSNAPLLEKLGVYHAEVDPEPIPAEAAPAATVPRARDAAPNFRIGSGAWLRGYEYLVDIDVVENDAHFWPWREVEPRITTMDDRPVGMLLLYNPATGRRNGTTPNFFATLTHMRANGPRPKPVRGHRHISSAINYHISGRGYSRVEGEEVAWGPGDLLLSAPGWAEHAHYPVAEEMLVFTVQDHPLHIGMDSLLWQEDMNGRILNLGSQKGFGTSAPRGGG